VNDNSHQTHSFILPIMSIESCLCWSLYSFRFVFWWC